MDLASMLIIIRAIRCGCQHIDNPPWETTVRVQWLGGINAQTLQVHTVSTILCIIWDQEFGTIDSRLCCGVLCKKQLTFSLPNQCNGSAALTPRLCNCILSALSYILMHHLGSGTWHWSTTACAAVCFANSSSHLAFQINHITSKAFSCTLLSFILAIDLDKRKVSLADFASQGQELKPILLIHW